MICRHRWNLLVEGSEDWQTLNTQMQALITQRDAIARSDLLNLIENEALLLQK